MKFKFIKTTQLVFSVCIIGFSCVLQARLCSSIILKRSYPVSNANLVSTLRVDKFKNDVDPLASYENEMLGFSDYEKTIMKVNYMLLDKFPQLAKHGSSFFHGSQAASLMSVLDHDPSRRGLIPSYVLLNEGRIPFIGELANGIAHPDGVNRNAISAADLPFVVHAISYSKWGQEAWTPEQAKSHVQSFKNDQKMTNDENSYMLSMSLKIENARLKRWQTLSDLEKSLVRLNFPVLYGIKPAKNKIEAVESRWGIAEYKINGRVDESEIKVIFVPNQNIPLVRSLMNEFAIKIPVESIDQLLEQTPIFNDFFSEYLK